MSHRGEQQTEDCPGANRWEYDGPMSLGAVLLDTNRRDQGKETRVQCWRAELSENCEIGSVGKRAVREAVVDRRHKRWSEEAWQYHERK